MFRLDSFPLMQKLLSVFSDHIKQSDSSAFTFFCYYDISSIVACQYKRPPTPASVCASSIPPSLPLKHLLTFLMFSLRLHIFSHCSPFHCLIKAIYICNIINISSSSCHCFNASESFLSISFLVTSHSSGYSFAALKTNFMTNLSPIGNTIRSIDSGSTK